MPKKSHLHFKIFHTIQAFKGLNKVYYYCYDVSTYSISYKLKSYNEENFQI